MKISNKIINRVFISFIIFTIACKGNNTMKMDGGSDSDVPLSLIEYDSKGFAEIESIKCKQYPLMEEDDLSNYNLYDAIQKQKKM